MSGATRLGKHTYEKEDIVTNPYDDGLVITVEVDGYDVKRLVVDSGSLMHILFLMTLHA